MAKTNPADKLFIDTCKMYLGSLSARGTMYAYFNAAPSTVVLCNSTSTASRESGDRLMKFAVGELSLHLVKFKAWEFWAQLSTLLQLYKLPAKTLAVVKLGGLLTLLSKCDNCVANIQVTLENGIISGKVPGAKYEVVLGNVVTDMHIAREIFRWCDTIAKIGSEEHRNSHVHLYREFPLITSKAGQNYDLPVTFSDFVRADGSQVFTNVHNQSRIIMVDGVTAVSMNFLKKVKSLFDMKYYLWVSDNQVQLQTEYHDDFVDVLTLRPHMVLYPLPLTTPLTVTVNI